LGGKRQCETHRKSIAVEGRGCIVKLLDTCFLIHLQREWVRNTPGPATHYLQRHAGDEFGVSVITVLEFLEGYQNPADGERFLDPFPQLAVTSQIARIASRIRRDLRQKGEMNGDFDILIAATALESGRVLVTDNSRHFGRVSGLVVEGYRD
jgi:tRNA(fMet)-specific endonuclease VapC